MLIALAAFATGAFAWDEEDANAQLDLVESEACELAASDPDAIVALEDYDTSTVIWIGSAAEACALMGAAGRHVAGDTLCYPQATNLRCQSLGAHCTTNGKSGTCRNMRLPQFGGAVGCGCLTISSSWNVVDNWESALAGLLVASLFMAVLWRRQATTAN